MRQLWRRWRARWAKPVVELPSIRRRLGFLLQAIYDRPLVDAIVLPPTLDARDGREVAEARYRLLGFEQAERAVRGTPAHAPADTLERDLYWLSEAAVVDATLARAMPGIRADLVASRAAALAKRPKPERLPPLERDVEMIVREVLGRDPSPLAPGAAAADSAAWARVTAQRLRAQHGTRRRYRAAKPVELWGAKPGAVERPVAEQDRDALRDPIEMPIRGTRAEARGDGGDADGPAGFASVSKGAPVPSDEPGEQSAESEPESRGDAGVPYPEWDAKAEQYRANAVLVRQCQAEEGDAEWGLGVREQHAPLVRRVRQRFELLRARRTRLGQQKDGDELDLSACVRALVDMHTGGPADDRLYVAVRPARRRIAIALLADVSGSTEAPVTATQQVIDVEKVALLLASEALDALGDPYAMLTFASRGARNVRLTTIKDFGEASGDIVRRRIAAMRPHGNTRMGAGVRHATARLLRQNAGHRLLLILSDGRPSDQDGYHEAYGIEDTRQAILEARAHDVFPFCLTVDREGADYLPHIFGASGHTILRHADQLPLALLAVVRQLLVPR